jgi:hypothetical protein
MRHFLVGMKYKDGYKLFKEKYRHDKKIKEGDKYFELEKVFKEVSSNPQKGNLSGRVCLM